MQSGIIKCCKILLVSLVLVSCGRSKEDEKLFEELNLALENSNKIIEQQSQGCLRKLENDLLKAETRDKASIWLEKAKLAEQLSNELIACLDSLQKQIKDGKTFESIEIKNIYTNLISYKQRILDIDGGIKTELGMVISLTKNNKDSTEITDTEFIKALDKYNIVIKLALYKNKVELIKEMILVYCSKMDGMLICGMIEYFNFIASQNSTHFKTNETLEIKAGIGSFSKSAMPRVSINNKKINLNYEGVAEFKEVVPLKPGKYNKIVKIEFTKPDGTIGTAEKEIIYTVDE